MHFLCYRCGLSLSDVKWRAESNALTSGSWIGVVFDLILKTSIFSKNSVFSTSKTNFLGPSATSGRIWSRDDLSHTLLQVLRKLHGCTRSSLVAVAFPEVEKWPKIATFLAKIQLFHNICLYKSMKEIFFAFGLYRTRCTFLRSFTSAIVIKLNIRTFFTRLVLEPKNRRKSYFCNKKITFLTTVKSKMMQIIWIDQIRNQCDTRYLLLGSYAPVPFELTKSSRFIYYRCKRHLIQLTRTCCL